MAKLSMYERQIIGGVRVSLTLLYCTELSELLLGEWWGEHEQVVLRTVM